MPSLIRKSIKNILRKMGTLKEYSFGACYCGNEGMSFNISRDNWMYCKKCKTKWCVGSNLFSSWRYENKKVWEKNIKEFAEYKEIEPICDNLDILWEKFIKRR